MDGTYSEHCSFAHNKRAFVAEIFHRSLILALFLTDRLAFGEESTALEQSSEGWL